MTNYEIERLKFNSSEVRDLFRRGGRFTNWPVVYTINGGRQVYVGETLNAAGRLRQHLDSTQKRELESVRIVMDDSFNKSVCLDLESNLIRLFAGDGQFDVLNRNEGITDANYYRRSDYQSSFREIFDELRNQGMFTRSIPEIENSDLFKYSPFKALTADQAVAVEDILEGLFEDLETETKTLSVIQGSPGTGKTVVGIYLLKLLSDIGGHSLEDPVDPDSIFSDFFTPGYIEIAKSLNVALVIPQQSLRESIQRVFQRTPGLSKHQVLSPFQIGESSEHFDLVVVDEAHRLNQRANMSSAALNKKFTDINVSLFGTDDQTKTQLDWIRSKANHLILLLDTAQSVKPADLPIETTEHVLRQAKSANRHYSLVSQMRVRADEDYVGYVRAILNQENPVPQSFAEYEFRLFDNLDDLYARLREKEREFGLCRLVAGYSWPWASKNDPTKFDIDIDGLGFRWNSVAKDWVNSPNAFNEVGSIHTVQGYDLNYAGVIIGPDLKFDPESQRMYVDRDNYFDSKGKENNPRLGKRYTDEDLLKYISNIYSVLLTRGIRGTFVFVSDVQLKNHLSRYFDR